MIKVSIADTQSGRSMSTASDSRGVSMMVAQPQSTYGVWTSYYGSLNGTATLANCLISQALGITDLIVNTEKVATTAELRFSDGTYTAIVWKANLKDNAVNVTANLRGKIEGWKNATLQIVTSGATIIGVTVGYMNIPSADTLDYLEWLNRRTAPS